jgi:hypothetical protein
MSRNNINGGVTVLELQMNVPIDKKNRAFVDAGIVKRLRSGFKHGEVAAGARLL